MKKSFPLVETERWNNRSKLCFGLRWRKTKYFFVFCPGKNLLVFVLLFYVIRVRIQSKCQIIRQFTRLHLRGMELANILSEWLRNPGNRTSESQNRKNFPRGTCTLTPPEAWAFGARLGNPSVFILIRSATTVHTFITAQSRNPDGYLCILSIPNLTPIMFWNRKGPKKPVRGLTGNTAAFAGYFT